MAFNTFPTVRNWIENAASSVCANSFLPFDINVSLFPVGKPSFTDQLQGDVVTPDMNSTLDPRCHVSVTWKDADRLCMSNGARLCSFAEAALTEGSRCGFDNNSQLIWTSSNCELDTSQNPASGERGVIAINPRATDTSAVCVKQDTQLAVRCCGDEINTASNTLSERSCQDLQWTQGKGRLATCGSSVDASGKCFTDGQNVSDTRSYMESEAQCKAVGARLCTIAEVSADEVRATGCQVDGRWAWTTTQCGRCGEDAVFQYMETGQDKRCVKKTDQAFHRCCADASSEGALLTGTSALTCGELDWNPLGGGVNDSSSVCAESEVIFNDQGDASCPLQPVPLVVAEEYCSAIGARLCDVSEIEAGDTRGTGVS